MYNISKSQKNIFRKKHFFMPLKKCFFVLFLFIYSTTNVFAWLIIEEVMPNTEDDKNLEYIQIQNPWNTEINLNWYYLSDKSGKEYYFWTWEVIQPWENKKYYRTETKIILNNTDEEIYLYNSWTLIDTFSYENSIKWDAININSSTDDSDDIDLWEEDNTWTWTQDNTNTWSTDSQEQENNTWTWTLTESWSTENTIETNTWTTETWTWDTTESWEQNTWTWEISSESGSWETNTWTIDILEIPDVNIEVQSWLEYLTWNTRSCKNEDCKINLTLENVFSWSYEEQNYLCFWNFWTWAIYTTDNTKCNPGYVSYWTWNFEITAKIYEKWNEENYKIWWLKIENTPDNNSWTWETNNPTATGNTEDPEIETSTWTALTDSWTTDSWTWETSSWFLEEEILVSSPEIIYDFQIPTYLLDKGIKKETYECNKEKDECKVNLNLESSFTWTYQKSDYKCEIDFWFWSWTLTWQEEKCNPSTVIFPIWEYYINFKIIYKNDESIYSTWTIKINNSEIIENNENNSDDSWWWWGGWGWWWVMSQEEKINIISPEIEIQSWLEEINWEYKCKKEDCKVNLEYEPKNSKEKCIWSFNWWDYSDWTQEKCNPWYVDYSLWTYEIKLKVYQNWVESNFKETILSFKNEEKAEEQTDQNPDLEQETQTEKISITTPEIEIQSWLAQVDWEYRCKKEDCKVNLEYEPKDSDEKCLWSFNWWSFSDWTQKKCNPWYVTYPLWTYQIKLKVYQKWKESNFKETTLNFKNLKLEEQEENTETEEEEITQEKTVKIILQWKQAKYKVIEPNSVKCIWVDKCNINLTSEVTWYTKKSDLVYKWNFWNKTHSDKANPSAIWYEAWEYEIELKVYENSKFLWENYFTVEVLPEEQVLEENEEVIEINISNEMLWINKIMVNPKWTDNWERIELINKTSKSINLKWCELDDDIWKWSKPYKFEEDFYLRPNQVKKFYKSLTKINLNNDQDSVNLSCYSKLIDSLSRNFDVKEWYYLNHDRLVTTDFKALVTKVVDWDTIEVQTESWEKIIIRLIWVDTPENNTYKQIFQYYWEQASKFTKEHLLWKEVLIELDSENDRDRYWRLLWYVIIDDQNFNKLLLEKWIAKPYFRYPFKYMEEFDKAYKTAKKEKLWMWADKEMKKILLEEIKEEQEIIEEEEETKQEEILELVDENQDEIPDEFEVIIEIDEETWEVTIDKEKSLENYKNYVIKTFKQSITKPKDWLKISWTTLPNSQVSFFLTWSWEQITIMSDKNWNYEFIIKDWLKIWTYTPKIVLIDRFWNEYIFNYNKEVVIDDEYIKKITEVKKAKKKTAKKKTTKKKTTKKEVVEEDDYSISKLNFIIPNANADSWNFWEQEVNAIYIFMLAVLSVVLIFVVFKRREIL